MPHPSVYNVQMQPEWGMYNVPQARREGGEFSRAPRRLGGPAIAQNTENGVQNGFFLT